jgi:hypothetical protein
MRTAEHSEVTDDERAFHRRPYAHGSYQRYAGLQGLSQYTVGARTSPPLLCPSCLIFRQLAHFLCVLARPLVVILHTVARAPSPCGRHLNPGVAFARGVLECAVDCMISWTHAGTCRAPHPVTHGAVTNSVGGGRERR